MSDLPWQPAATIEQLKQRAQLIANVRAFFAARNVLEVETPALARYSVTDPHMEVLTAEHPLGEASGFYLQTSPEYAMKRLLATGSGPIFQIAKAFRKGELGSRHNPEFTMLEWYRPGFDDHQLMDEIAELLVTLLGEEGRPLRQSYRQVFQQVLAIDPHEIDCRALEVLARQHIDIQMQSDDRDDWLNLLMAEVIEPALADGAPTFIYDYPASQAALAQVASDDQGVTVARRFELYMRGVELANGYLELLDAQEQRRRFAQEQQKRQQLNRPAVAADQYLLAALEAGMPACAGVALGLDRLVMLALGLDTIQDVMAFPADRA